VEYKRAERVAGLIKEEVSLIIQKDVKDPRVSLATITSVKVSDDLKIAKVYFVCDSNKQKSTKEGFDRSKGFIKKMLASKVKLRYIPDIAFYYDSSLDYSSKINSILKEVTGESDK
jgi:ribosome-binding factor A